LRICYCLSSKKLRKRVQIQTSKLINHNNLNKTILLKPNLLNKQLLIFLFYIVLFLLIDFFIKKFIFTDSFYYNSFYDEISLSEIENLVNLRKKYDIFSYILIPIFFFLKLVICSALIYITIVFFELNIDLKKCFKIVLYAESVTILSSITNTLYLYIYPPQRIEDIKYFNPLGLISLLKHDTIPKYLIYPFQQLNLFEVGYWLLLAYGIKRLGNVDFKKALKITSLSYGVGLVIWCIFIVFLELQFS
jgi:hypothetical protein